MDMTAATRLEFVELTTPHLSRLFRIGMRLTHQPVESQDLVQEVLLKAWTHWARFRRDGALGAWLSRILMNTFISRHRHHVVICKTAARPDLVTHLFDPKRLAESHAPETAWTNTQFSDEIAAALAELAPAHRDVIEKIDIQGLSYNEASTALDCPLGTVMSRLHRARRLLRESLKSYGRHYGFGAPQGATLSE